MSAVRRTLCLAAVVVLPLLLGGGGAGAQVITGEWLMYGNDPARSSATSTSLSPPSVRPAWWTPISGRVSAQALVAQDIPTPGRRTVYVTTNKGLVYALAENGYIRWRVELGQLDRICQQIDGYGVTGTGVIDKSTRTLYVADAFGRMHALDLLTGAERPGWPVTLYTDYRRELVWGAMTLLNGSLYVGTGSYCDRPMVGKVIRLDLATRQVSSWVSVPQRLGGGGSVWGWGGVSYNPERGSLYVATGNAFRGGMNDGKRFRESAGYGLHMVELGLDLSFKGAHHPPEMKGRDLGFAGSPVIFRHRFCGQLVAAINKDGFIYVWRAPRVRAGTLFRLRLSNPTHAAPLLSQPAYSPLTGAIYVATPGRLVRVDVNRRCKGRVTWGKRVGSGLFNGSPTIAGNTVWLAENAIGGSALLGYDARTGANRYRSRLAGPTYVAPTVVGDRIYLPTYIGGVQGFVLDSGRARIVGTEETPLPEHRSFADGLHGWVSKEDGVYASDDGGLSWRLIYPRSAIRVARITAQTGMISLGDRVTRCGCKQARLWTADGGLHWHSTQQMVGEGFVGGGNTLWWWHGGNLFRAAQWPPAKKGLRRYRIAQIRGAILDAKPVPNGIAALVTSRVAGIRFDHSPRILLVRGPVITGLTLPAVEGQVLVRSLDVSWPQLTVRGVDVAGFTRAEQGAVTWRSADGGTSWRVDRS
jgi:DNA-binding beta-propeller fold protein YncE